MEYKKQIFKGYNLHTIKTDKFKLCHIEVIFRNNIQKEDITKRNILFDLLCECSKDYPTRRNLNLKLEELYNAQTYTITSKVGNAIISNFCMDFISPTYTEGKIPKEAIKLLFNLILNPLANNHEFDSKNFELVKKRLKDEIKSVKENPTRLAIFESLQSLGNTPSSYSAIGYEEDIDEITEENLYAYYEKVLNNDYVDIYVIGDLDMDEITNTIIEYAKFKVIKNHPLAMYVNNLKLKEKEINKNYKYVQSNIVMILNLKNLTSYEKKYVANIYNIILGGGSLQTKLYKKLRNENSLCYTVNSNYQKYDGLILITTAVDTNQTAKAIKLIKKAIKEMSNNITDEELNKAKETIITSLNMNKDSIGRIVDNYFYQDISDLDDIETRIKTFKEININEIYDLSKKISISTIYTLNGGTNE